MYHAVTHNIHVEVTPLFLAEESDPQEHRYLWAYTVHIRNEGHSIVQLIARHWVIIDGFGTRREVKGPGVVGQQPLLHPSQSFSYTSTCPLSTPDGLMSGSFSMIQDNGLALEVAIPAFSLDSPYQERKMHS